MDEFPKRNELSFCSNLLSSCYTEEYIIHFIFFFYVIKAFFCNHFVSFIFKAGYSYSFVMKTQNG